MIGRLNIAVTADILHKSITTRILINKRSVLHLMFTSASFWFVEFLISTPIVDRPYSLYHSCGMSHGTSGKLPDVLSVHQATFLPVEHHPSSPKITEYGL